MFSTVDNGPAVSTSLPPKTTPTPLGGGGALFDLFMDNYTMSSIHM